MVITFIVDYVIIPFVKYTNWCMLIDLLMYSWYNLCYNYISLNYSILNSLYYIVYACCVTSYMHHSIIVLLILD